MPGMQKSNRHASPVHTLTCPPTTANFGNSSPSTSSEARISYLLEPSSSSSSSSLSKECLPLKRLPGPPAPATGSTNCEKEVANEKSNLLASFPNILGSVSKQETFQTSAPGKTLSSASQRSSHQKPLSYFPSVIHRTQESHHLTFFLGTLISSSSSSSPTP